MKISELLAANPELMDLAAAGDLESLGAALDAKAEEVSQRQDVLADLRRQLADRYNATVEAVDAGKLTTFDEAKKFFGA